MSTRWHYRIHGRDVGPVDFATLQVMAKEERLFADDEIRSEESSQWVAADTVPGLFPESADEDDLSSMLADAGPEPAPAERIAPQDACYCRTRTEELGPMTLDKLVDLARSGRLARRDQVRIGTHGNWVEARSVAGLFEDPSQATREASSMLEGFEIVADPTPRKPRAPRQAPEPVLQMEDDDVAVVAVPDQQAEWTCRVLGQEIGPVSWKDMRELVETRQLGPNDRVRKGNSVAWVPAGTIADLFPKRKKKKPTRKKLSEDDVLDILQPEEPEDEEVSSHLAPQRSFERAQRKSAPETPVRRPSPVEDAGPSEPRGTPQAPHPGLAAAIAAAPAPRPGTIPPPPRPVPQREKQKRGNPFAGLKDRLSDVTFSADSLSSLWKPLAAIAVLVAVIFGIVTAAPLLFPRFSEEGKKYYLETRSVWRTVQETRNGGSAAEWKAMVVETLPKVNDLAKQIEPIASKDDRLLQLMLLSNRDTLPEILGSEPGNNESAWNEMIKNMDEAQKIFAGL